MMNRRNILQAAAGLATLPVLATAARAAEPPRHG